MLPDLDGIQVVRRLRAAEMNVPKKLNRSITPDSICGALVYRLARLG
jgi:CheY-like chemotaxis protein